ncbi:TetR/AcrR family transcriptional regulator [uncultured Jatrophihabitans sp.]|uniref:TetR/AcrR family transcriptional regulator n=1 Tax=uncultured Jatrophihabitans sp. TaxID=1610747 RepID=UPI0035CC1A15
MERLTVEDYYRAAFDILGESGSEALTINALCERLQVTKGSFYHHFGALPGFVDALLLFWESEHSERLIAISKAQPDPTLRITTLIDMALSLPHACEAAIRAWARSNPEVNAVTVRVDRRRERHVADAIVALGLDRPAARLLARMTLNLLIGAQQREQPVDPKRLRQSFEEFQKLIFLEADPDLVARLVGSTAR